MEKGRNLWGSNPKRAETSGNRPGTNGGLGGPQTPCLVCFHIVQDLATPLKKEEENKGQQGSCKSCLPCFIAVVLDFDQRLLGNKDKTNNKKEMGKIRHFNIWVPKPPGPKWKRAETSGGQIRKGPKPLATALDPMGAWAAPRPPAWCASTLFRT